MYDTHFNVSVLFNDKLIIAKLVKIYMSSFDRFNTKVLKAIRKLDTGKTGSLGPTLDEIAEEAGVERHVAAETLAKMKDSGVLYEPRPGKYRLV